MPTRQDLLAPARARHPVARCGAWHVARAMRTMRGAALLSTWCAWFMAFLVADSMTTADVASRLAQWARLFAMACRSAAVVTRSVITLTSLFAFPVIRTNDLAVHLNLAFVTGTFAGVTARQYSAAHGWTTIIVGVDISAAELGDLVVASGYRAFHANITEDLGGVLKLPARQRCHVMTTSQL